MYQHSRTDGGRADLLAHWPIAVVLVVGLLAGVVLGNDYGISWDEVPNADVGADALQVYVGSDAYFSDPGLAEHGPVYFMIQSVSSTMIAGILPGWTVADGRHLTNYVTFLAGVLFFYLLCLRRMRPATAGLTAALFATQPLFFGSAFVNQKDIPFLTFFLATLVTGLAAADRWRTSGRDRSDDLSAENDSPPGKSKQRLWAEWSNLGVGRQRLLGAIVVVALLLIVELFFVGTLRRTGQSMVVAAYNGKAPALIQQLFARMAANSSQTPLALYLAKYDLYYTYFLVTVTPLLIFVPLVSYSVGLPSIGDIWGFSWKEAIRPALLASAVLLGLTICVRQIGAFVGGLVSLAMLYRGRGRALFPLVVYWLTAGVITVITWPYIWPDPYSRLVGSFFLTADFPGHNTLFEAQVIDSRVLPWDFFPKLASLQLTETALALFALGLVVLILTARKGDRGWFLEGILGLWVVVPLVGLIFFHMSVYGIRHLLFVFPPLLVVAGIGLEAGLHRLRRTWTHVLLCGIVLLPGVLGIAQLHPYEYVYFNTLAGGVNGANGNYSMDTWCISYREAIEYVNTVAEPRAVVVVPDQTSQVVPFARPDLRLIDASRGVVDADFVLSCTWRDKGRWDTRRFLPVYQVHRGSVVLTEVWQHRSD